jgi:catecholate siderophore receptor
MAGSIVDPTGAPITGARVTIQNAAKQPVAEALTDEHGGFTATLAAGRYDFSVSANGFDPLRKRIEVTGVGTTIPALILQVSGVRESLTVQADRVPVITSTKVPTAPRDTPQSITVVSQDTIRDQLMGSIADVVRYVPGITAHQGENNRDDVIIRGNRSSADFFVNGVRDDVQYYRDLYNVERVEALKGPNALLFGRGGGGGVVNRVLKEPEFQPLRGVAVQGGSFDNRRVTADVGQGFGRLFAARLNGMFERSESFRSGVNLEREAINPAVTLNAGSRTKITLGYEFLRDRRVADRGITSFRGRPAVVAPSTFYGDPAQSAVRAQANLGSVLLEHSLGSARIRNRTLAADYDRFYQNFVPGAVSADAALVSLTAYNNATNRTNLFNQTDIVVSLRTGRIGHTFLSGLELGRQRSDNFRQTGFFGGETTTLRVPFDRPTIAVPVTFRQNATDASNHVNVGVGAAFVQDEMQVTRHLRLLTGVRVDRFDLRYTNHRNGDQLRRTDDLFSPRAGIIIKPIELLSIYGSYSVSYLPSSGDQFSSLTVVTKQLEPERFGNYEAGIKWDLPAGISVTAAAYRLDRTNTRSTDPNDATRIVQTGSQRSTGAEIGINGRITQSWIVIGGYANQNAVVTSATAAAATGARVGQVPRHMASVWNRVQLTERLGAALGVVYRSGVFAAVDNTVTLPGYTRTDAAGFFALTRAMHLQINVENLLDRAYFVNADSNTNISPGAPRSVRIALNARF